MSLIRKALILAIPPAILFVILAGLRFVAEAIKLPDPIPRIFSVGIAVILSSVYVGLVAHRRGLDRAWGVVPTMVLISLLAQVVVVAIEGILASVTGAANYFNGSSETLSWRHVLVHLTFIAIGEGLLLSIPALIIYFIVAKNSGNRKLA
ncbi:MAG TPA: hypothetical protein VFC63_05390 [Blastocatellia bacterium]|nr:hypothetical protein [Blastocatellia bacterium]